MPNFVILLIFVVPMVITAIVKNEQIVVFCCFQVVRYMRVWFSSLMFYHCSLSRD